MKTSTRFTRMLGPAGFVANSALTSGLRSLYRFRPPVFVGIRRGVKKFLAALRAARVTIFPFPRPRALWTHMSPLTQLSVGGPVPFAVFEIQNGLKDEVRWSQMELVGKSSPSPRKKSIFSPKRPPFGWFSRLFGAEQALFEAFLRQKGQKWLKRGSKWLK